MRITEVVIEGLFEIFDHTISLNTEERITIIHGPNGFGKTILLQMLNGLFNGNYAKFRSIPFRKFEVRLDEGSAIWIDKISEPNGQQQSLWDSSESDDSITEEYAHLPKTPITINFLENGGQPQFFTLESISEDDIHLPMIEDMTGLERIGTKLWRSDHGETLSLDEVIDRFGHRLPFTFDEPDWWIKVKEATKIHLIETQRLLNVSSRRMTRNRLAHSRSPTITWVRTVEEYSNELARTIQEKLAQSAALSQSLDRTFPVRLVEQMGASKLTEDQIRNKLDELEKKRSRLEEVGLLDKEQDMAFLPAKQISKNTEEVLSVYVQDVEEKLSVLDEITNKIDLFKQIINERFRYNRMTISRQEGFSFLTRGDKPLPVTSLSSGEQHELVLLYQLLFEVRPNSLILIDEPELSLHVAWQQQFLQDLQKITQLASFDVLIATHSPQIIHDRWDLTVELKGPEIS
jgi:predicted ATP-binding protein involved in virulence